MAMEKRDKRDVFVRGNEAQSPLGSTLFVVLRSAEVFLQYGILGAGWGASLLSGLGLPFLTEDRAVETGTPLDALGLSPYRLILVGMSAAAALKQMIWRSWAGEPMPVNTAVMVGAVNVVLNSVNSFLFLYPGTSAVKHTGEWSLSMPLLVGSTLFVGGLAIELVSEIERALFKSKKPNQGKPYTSGLWSLSRHPNYLGFTLYRAGWALAASGWSFGFFIAAVFTYDFTTRAIPVLEEYCEGRYGDMWRKYQKRT